MVPPKETRMKSVHRKVLTLAHLFPPTPETGAVRVGKLAKYLPAFG